MAQYRPSNLIPSTLTSTYTVDATVANEFRCQINGSSPTIKYRLKIMQNNAASTSVYDSGVVSLSNPLYPTDYTGTVNELIVTVPANTMTNGNEYKWSIASYWTNTNYYESYENVFKAYKEPTLTLEELPSPITTKDYTFSATFNQAQGIQVERFGWQLNEKGSDTFLVDTITSNNIYSNDIKMYYDGLFSGTNYEIRVVCWDYNNISLDTGKTEFTVSYDTLSIEGLVNASQTKDSGVLVEWSNINIITGEISPSGTTPQYVNDSFVESNTIKLDGSTLTYSTINGEPISFSDASYVICFKKPDAGSSADGGISLGGVPILSIEDGSGNSIWEVEYNIITNDIYCYYGLKPNVGGTHSFSFTKNQLYDWFILILNPTSNNPSSPNYSYLISYGLYDAVLPSINTIISDNLYPSDGVYTSRVRSAISPVGMTDNPAASIVLKSPNLINYFWVTKNNGGNDILEYDPNTVFQQEPEWDSNTLLLATFNNTLSAGNYSSNILPIGWSVYRQSEFEFSLHKVADISDVTRTYVVDYAVADQTLYTYFVFPVFENTIGVANSSNNVRTNWWDWYLLTCDYDEENKMYYVDDVFKFDLDVSSGQMSNNTAFNTLNNFTKYAKIQHSNASYWSGTLTALLGNCAVNYVDTVAEMNAIKALTTDNKYKFLKDRKGNLWKVALNNPVNETINDAYVEQAVSVTLNWAEVGDASNDRIIQSADYVLENEDGNVNIAIPLFV